MWYWRLYALLSIAGFALIVNYLTDGQVQFVWLVKFPQVALLLLLFAFHLKRRVRITGVAVLFLFGGISAILIGIIRGTIVSPGLMIHLFMTVMPLLAASFGAQVAKLPESLGTPIHHAALRQIFLMSALTILLYAYFHYVTGQIAYFGFDSYIPVAVAWYIAERRHGMIVISTVLVILSGKRAPLVTMFVVMVVNSWQSVFSMRGKRLVFSVGIMILFAAILWIADRFNIFYRFDAVFAVDVTDTDSLFLATGGRSSEVLGLLVARKDAPELWWTGGGFGDGYTSLESAFSEQDTLPVRHYFHLALLTYVMVFGIPFTVILLCYIGVTLWRLRRQVNNFYVIGTLMMFIWSLFGAGMVVEPMFWFFLGACTSLTQLHREASAAFHR